MRIFAIISLSFLFCFYFLVVTVYAGCMSDCKYEYESEVQSCQLLWGDDPDSYYMLQSCIENANSDYESCKEECLS